MANFNIDEEEEIDSRRAKVENSKDWEEIIPEQERRKIEDEERQQMEAELYLPPRQRNKEKIQQVPIRFFDELN